jgi:hypothetical protein
MKQKYIFLSILFISLSMIKTMAEIPQKCQLWQWNISLSLTDNAGKNYDVSPYLWIPPMCAKINAVMFASTATIEQSIVEDPSIRSVCKKYGIAIVWSDTQFYHDEQTGLKQIQDILDGFADVSGYSELKTVPWIPIGHSATLKMIRDMAKAKMENLAFMIMNKNNNNFGYCSAVPVLTTYGEFVEWDSYNVDLKAFPGKDKAYTNVIKARESQLLVSYFSDPNSGHFDCSKPLMTNIARWMDAVCALRFDHSGNLKEIDQTKGWVCQPPVPGYTGFSPKRFEDTKQSERSNAWYPTYETALAAYNEADVSMTRTAQLAGFADSTGNYETGWWRAVMYSVPYRLNDNGTLTINTIPYYKMPQGQYANKFTDDKSSPDTGKLYTFFNKDDVFTNSGNPLELEVMCGNLIKVNNRTFEYVPRFNSPNYLVVREAGNIQFRSSVQPGRLTFQEITEGKENVINFPTISAIRLNHISPTPLKANASSGLNVKYFVKSGAAHIVENNRLIIEQDSIPPRTKFPYTITVTAYQLGSVNRHIKSAQQKTIKISVYQKNSLK